MQNLPLRSLERRAASADIFLPENNLAKQQVEPKDPVNGHVNISSGWDNQTGWGEINIQKAFEKLIGSRLNPVEDFSHKHWGLNRINAPEVWTGHKDLQGVNGQGALVAVIDTGVDLDHVDLASNIWTNPYEIAGDGLDNDGNGFIDDVHGWDFVDNDNHSDESGGTSHGTHVAGTIAAVNNGFGQTGVAYGAKILPIRVLGPYGGYSSDVAAGIRYAAEMNADVINLSLGASSFSSRIYDSIRYATGLGSVVVMAAGNKAQAQPGYPARHANEYGLAVGALNSAGELAGFSNRSGDRELAYVTAAGVSVYSTIPDNRFAYYSGTSMAAPHVSGAVALLRSYDPPLSVDAIVDLLTSTTGPNQPMPPEEDSRDKARGYIESGAFNPLQYIASYDDLVGAFGTNLAAAQDHWINHGYEEGRQLDGFEEVQYLASYGDLITAFGHDLTAATYHWILHGYFENRSSDSFDALSYTASYGDLILALGPDQFRAASHYVRHGYSENRRILFDAQSYLHQYADLQAAFGQDLHAAKLHYINQGFYEGRSF